ncbi:MAG: ABC transporter ATP-binding protein [Deltaproteobacteria bacterium]|nr:ABC transporter ATP-binding protein [Deltaproteobacteria bacterium]
MRRLLTYLVRYRGRYAIGCFCLLATATLAMAVPYLLKRAIDEVAHGGGLRGVSFYAGLIVGIALIQGVVRTFSRALIFNVGRDVEYDLRNDLFRHLECLPLAFYQQQQTGDLMSRLVNDVTAVRMLLGPGVLNLVNTPLYYVYGVAIMLSLDPRLTVAALLPYPLLLLVVKHFSRKLMEYTMRVQEGLAELSSRVQENLSGIHVVRAYAAEERQTAAFAAINERFKQQSMELARIRGQLFPVMRTASSLGTLVLLWYGGGEVIDGRLSLGDLVAFIGYLNLLAWPTMAMGWMLSILQRGRAAMHRLDHIFTTEPAIADAPDASPLPVVRGHIELRDVEFAYRTAGNGHPILQRLSIDLAPGQMLALVGRTGSGKSTIAALLPRLYDVVAGQILLDGRDVRTLPLAQLRRSIGFVPQDPFLFSTTVRANIAFGVDSPGETAIHRAATIAGLSQDIDDFPRGYDTVVGERGITLSGGQKQRLTLARALLPEPPILVLDDALSSVDTRTERAILTALEQEMGGRTRVVIAHRISTIQHADIIAVVDDGHIVELGDHAALLAHDGIYAEMLRQQRLEEELAEL